MRKATRLFALGWLLTISSPSWAGETLPNGIRLPEVWPPVVAGPLNDEPMAVPYLQTRPPVVPIEQGRQLFVDDFLIESSTLKRTFHRPKYHPASPVLRPERAWEQNDLGGRTGAFSDGVWYDPQQRQFLMWYVTPDRATCLAVSDDGLDWQRPKLSLRPGTNVVLESIRDSSTVWLDANAAPEERFKLIEARYKQKQWQLALHISPDGRRWSDELVASGPSWDRSTIFYNPFRQVWVASVRGHDHAKGERVHRLRCYHEGRTPAEALDWKQSSDAVAKGDVLPNDLQPWVGADRLDPRHPDPRFRDIPPQLYNLDAFPYESLLVGLFTIWQGPDNEELTRLNINKRNEVLVGFTRDGFHWDRPDRRPFLPVSQDPKSWNAGNVQSVGGGCLVMRDELWFYCTGRRKDPAPMISTGMARLRRDGFASLDAPPGGGELTTRLVQFTGGRLFVNASPGAGKLRVAVLDVDGKPIPGFELANCQGMTGDQTLAAIHWNGKERLASLANRPVRFRFHLESGSLWSFWVTDDPAGSSGGYVAAGGPDYDGPRDEPPKRPAGASTSKR